MNTLHTEHTVRNVELKPNSSFQNHPNSFRDDMVLPQTFPYRTSTMQSFKSYSLHIRYGNYKDINNMYKNQFARIWEFCQIGHFVA